MVKKIVLLVFLVLFVSCDFIWKNKNNSIEPVSKVEVVGEKVDAHGCATESGYRWSQLKKECIRIVEEGYRLNPKDSLDNLDYTLSCFVLMDSLETKAELFFPDETMKSVVISRKSSKEPFVHPVYELKTKKEFVLLQNNEIIYKGALTVDRPVSGSDEER